MKEIRSIGHYNKLFSNKHNEGGISKRHEALKNALDIRKFEIDLYWKRASYFWTFIGATLAGYIVVLVNNDISGGDKNIILYILACLGYCFSLSWHFVNRGSKFWQNNWERHVDMLEDNITGPLYKVSIKKRKRHLLNPIKEYPFSVSKINQILSVYIVLIWILLGGRTLYTLGVRFNLGSFSNNITILFFESLEFGVLFISTIIYTFTLLTLGQTSQKNATYELIIRDVKVK